MIDTKKYEGHTPTKEWGNIVYADGYSSIFLDENVQYVYATDTDRRLMADAPLLLEEVIRLQSYIAHHEDMRTYARYRQCPECGSIDFTFKFDDESMECKCDKCNNIWKVKLE